MAHSFNLKFPVTERLKNIPGIIGIRLSDEPRYHILDMDDEKEIRQYDRMTIASVTLFGNYEKVINEGYYKLAAYLFGENALNLEMPVSTPILEEKVQNGWVISFILPKGMTMASAPTPHDLSIIISEIPRRKVAVIWYTGGNNLKRVNEKSAELYRWLLSQAHYSPQGKMLVAQYDSPSTLDFFRRNELQVEVAKAH
jgi:hypothetical protein